jgi:regulator of sigma E protease
LSKNSAKAKSLFNLTIETKWMSFKKSMEIILQVINIIFWFIVLLIPLVAIHEFGHLLMSRLVGVRIIEYGIGIPPRAAYKYWKGIVWSLNWIPLGGFARIYGDHDAIDEAQDTYKADPEAAKKLYLEERYAELIRNREVRFFLEKNNLEYDQAWKQFEESDGLPQIEAEELSRLKNLLETLIMWEYDQKIVGGENKDAFFAKKLWQQILILVGGVSFNFITAIIIFWIAFGFTGSAPTAALGADIKEAESNGLQVQKLSNEITVLNVVKDSPAEKIGLKTGDELLTINGNKLEGIENNDKFKEILYQQETVKIEYRNSENKVQIKTVELGEKDGKKFFGIGQYGYLISIKEKNLGKAFSASLRQTWAFTELQLSTIGKLAQSFAPGQDTEVREQVGGPVAIGNIGDQVFNIQGYRGLLNIAALLSIGLGVFNLLPIPALDGGRIVIAILNKLFGRRNKKLEGIAIGVTFIFLIGLSILITFNDVKNVFF